MISEDDRRTLQPLIDWCQGHPDQNFTAAVMNHVEGVPDSTARSWSDRGILPEKRDDGAYAWHTDQVPAWLAVCGGPLATAIRDFRTRRSLGE